ncbi:MAG TPA: hypothetical protein ENJ87_04970 [Gammaproteobacteria bacterium]|nr:hypothetical protein [Gammaproteobacteria bacterium]
MKYSCYSFRRKALVAGLSLALPMVVSAAQTNEEIQKELDALQNQVNALSSEVQQATEWKNPNTLVHLAGYASVGYVDQENEDGSFNVGNFSPIFHFQYRDLVMMESELEIGVTDDGETEVEMEYMTIDWFMTDYATLVVGKFLSPLGNFRQNLHPSWINKLPSAPPGFGHDGAAAVSDLGFQVRGGFHIGGMKTNYAVYVSNGPELNAGTEDGIEYELDGVAAEGFGADRDGKKVVGGRIGFLPMPSLEIGLSAASGKATVSFVENESNPLAGVADEISGETARDYDVLGADFVWFNGGMSLRGEYVKTDVGSATTGITASGGASWETWYTQFAYRLPNTKYEGVIRYTDFASPNPLVDQKQTALGANYLFTSNFIAKLAYEFNDGDAGANSNADRLMVQLAYGF